MKRLYELGISEVPWTITGKGVFIILDSSGNCIASTCGDSPTKSQAIARLMNESPKLYLCLYQMVEEMKHVREFGADEETDRVVARACEALSEAAGESEEIHGE